MRRLLLKTTVGDGRKRKIKLLTSRWIGMRNRSDQIEFHYFEMFKSSFEHDVVIPVSHPSTLR